MHRVPLRIDGQEGEARVAVVVSAKFIEALPEGYDTVVGEGGMRLSGGERQRLGIARAMVRDAPILILDEPTAGLDTEAERLVFAGLARLRAGPTTFVIAHRMATICQADMIFVLDAGGSSSGGRTVI